MYVLKKYQGIKPKQNEDYSLGTISKAVHSNFAKHPLYFEVMFLRKRLILAFNSAKTFTSTANSLQTTSHLLFESTQNCCFVLSSNVLFVIHNNE